MNHPSPVAPPSRPVADSLDLAPDPVVGMADGRVRGWTLPLRAAAAAADALGPEAVRAMLGDKGAWLALDCVPSDVLHPSCRRRLEALAVAVPGTAEAGRVAVRLTEPDLSALPTSLALHLADLLADTGLGLVVRGAGVGPDAARLGFLGVAGLSVRAVGLDPSVTAALDDPAVSRLVAQLGSRLSGLGIAGIAEGVTSGTVVERLLRRGWALGQGPRYATVRRPGRWYPTGRARCPAA